MTDDERSRLKFIVVTMVLVFGSNLYGALTHAGPRFALLSTAFSSLVMLAGTAWRRDPVLARWMVIGILGGLLETSTDAWLVSHSATLIYPPGEPMLWDSPLYMPFAWMLVLTQLGTVGGWLATRMTLLRATLVCAVLGGINIPAYEAMAYYAGYWAYDDTPMLFHAPLYIAASEFFIALPLVWMNRTAVSHPAWWSLPLGAGLGLFMLPCVMLAWKLLGPCSGAWIQFTCKHAA